MRLETPKSWSGIISKIKRKFRIGPDLAAKAIQYASERGLNILKIQGNIALLSTFIQILEEVKVESILKVSLTGQALFAAKKMQNKIDDPDMVPLAEKDLHITLAAGPAWKKLRNNVKAPMPEPKFRIDFTDPQKVIKGNRTSWFAKAKQQKDIDNYVMELLGTIPNPDRVYHVSLANKTGKIGDSVALVEFFTLGVSKPTKSDVQSYLDNLGSARHILSIKDITRNIEQYFKTIKNVKIDRSARKIISFEEFETEERDYKDEYKKFQATEKMKKYRAELNKYNRKKGTYGNHDGKDASHKGGKIVGMEDESSNRGKSEKSRLTGSKRKKWK